MKERTVILLLFMVIGCSPVVQEVVLETGLCAPFPNQLSLISPADWQDDFCIEYQGNFSTVLTDKEANVEGYQKEFCYRIEECYRGNNRSLHLQAQKPGEANILSYELFNCANATDGFLCSYRYAFDIGLGLRGLIQDKTWEEKYLVPLGEKNISRVLAPCYRIDVEKMQQEGIVHYVRSMEFCYYPGSQVIIYHHYETLPNPANSPERTILEARGIRSPAVFKES